MLQSEYDREHDQIHIADDSGQMVSLSGEQALVLLRWLSQLFSRCQGCDQKCTTTGIKSIWYAEGHRNA